jgi:hypothetical protein
MVEAMERVLQVCMNMQDVVVNGYDDGEGHFSHIFIECNDNVLDKCGHIINLALRLVRAISSRQRVGEMPPEDMLDISVNWWGDKTDLVPVLLIVFPHEFAGEAVEIISDAEPLLV